MSGKRFTTCPKCGGLCKYPSENFKQAGILVSDNLDVETLLSKVTNEQLLKELTNRYLPLLQEMGFKLYTSPEPKIFISSKYMARVINDFENERDNLFGFAHLSEINKLKSKE